MSFVVEVVLFWRLYIYHIKVLPTWPTYLSKKPIVYFALHEEIDSKYKTGYRVHTVALVGICWHIEVLPKINVINGIRSEKWKDARKLCSISKHKVVNLKAFVKQSFRQFDTHRVKVLQDSMHTYSKIFSYHERNANFHLNSGSSFIPFK